MRNDEEVQRRFDSFDWNGNGVRDGFDAFMDFMVISDMNKEDDRDDDELWDEGDEDNDD